MFNGFASRFRSQSATVDDPSVSVTEAIPKKYETEEKKKHEGPPNVPDNLWDPELGRSYQVREIIGRGGFAYCYKVFDEESLAFCALKVIRKSCLSTENRREKVRREVEIQRVIQHKNIVRLYSAFEDDENVYMVLELCELDSLLRVLGRRKSLTQLEARYYLWNLLTTVYFLHTEQSVLHRDLKLSNLLLDRNMQLKLCDFGLAVEMDKAHNISICGTPNYMAPEVVMREGHTPQTEAWSIGCIFYALLVGHPPFESGSLRETYELIRESRFEIPDYLCLSANAKSLIRGLLVGNAMNRLTIYEAMCHPFFHEERMVVSLLPVHCTRSPHLSELEFEQNDEKHSGGQLVQNLSFGGAHFPASRRQGNGGKKKAASPEPNSGNGRNAPSPKHPAPFSRQPNVLPAWVQTFGAALNGRLPGRPIFNFDKSSSQPIFVIQWCEFSDKFGVQFSDGSVCVIFHDNVSISSDQNGTLFQIRFPNRTLKYFNNQSVPSEYNQRIRILNQLGETFNFRADLQPVTAGCSHFHRTLPYVCSWICSTKYSVFQLSNGKIQITFQDLETSFIVVPENVTMTDDVHKFFRVNLVDSGRQHWNYSVKVCKDQRHKCRYKRGAKLPSWILKILKKTGNILETI